MNFFLKLFLLGLKTAEGKNDKRSKKEEKVMSPKILQNPIDHIGNRGDTSKQIHNYAWGSGEVIVYPGLNSWFNSRQPQLT